METVKDQSTGSVNTAGSKLRYPLRSASKLKDPLPTTTSSSASKRGRPASNVSKSVGVLEISGKEKSAKPPRRQSIPAKSSISPLPRPTSTITPISETRVLRSTGQGKIGTPGSDISKSLNQRKFSVISSASYWLSQIKLSESAAKHSISLGFFKLAQESGSEPLQRLRDELKSYARKHNLIELGEPAKELLKSYNILEDLEQLQVSETCSHGPEGTQSTDEDVRSTNSTGAGKLKPKSLNSESFQSSTVADSAKESTKKQVHEKKNRTASIKNSKDLKTVTATGGANSQKKPQRSSKRQEAKREKIQNQEKKPAEETDAADPLPAEETQQEDKENLDAQQMEEISLTEVI